MNQSPRLNLFSGKSFEWNSLSQNLLCSFSAHEPSTDCVNKTIFYNIHVFLSIFRTATLFRCVSAPPVSWSPWFQQLPWCFLFSHHKLVYQFLTIIWRADLHSVFHHMSPWQTAANHLLLPGCTLFFLINILTQKEMKVEYKSYLYCFAFMNGECWNINVSSFLCVGALPELRSCHAQLQKYKWLSVGIRTAPCQHLKSRPNTVSLHCLVCLSTAQSKSYWYITEWIVFQ